MSSENARFEAYQIRDAVGQLADGMPVDPDLLPYIRAAVTGVCATADRGAQYYVVALYAVNLHNVDTEELIWPNDPDKPPQGDVPLFAMTDPELWEKLEAEWLANDPIAWTAFVWRVAVPLARRLGVVGAWRRRGPA